MEAVRGWVWIFSGIAHLPDQIEIIILSQNLFKMVSTE